MVSLFLFCVHIYFVPKQNILSWNEVELIEIKHRMDEYPPFMYRTANILENRLKYLYRLEKIFFSFFDFNSVYYFLTPIFVICLFKLFENKKY